MVGARNTIKGLDTGQISEINRLDKANNEGTKLEMLKSVKNQQSNERMKEVTNAMENVNRINNVEQHQEEQGATTNMTAVRFHEDTIMEEAIDQRKVKYGEKKGISIEIEMEVESDEQTCAITIVTVAETLLKEWKQNKVIDGVLSLNGRLMKNKFEKVEQWAIAPKIVKKKKHVAVEMILELQSKESVFNLYQNQKEYCEKHKIRLSARNTRLEYTKRVGFLIGPCLKFASPRRYIEEINNYLDLEEGVVEVKKKYTFERGSRSKVLVICVIESKAKEVDELLCLIKSPRFKYISYRKSTSDEKLRAMYINDQTNATGKYEILENVSLNDEVIDDKTNEVIELEQMIMSSEKGSQRLFVAVEQGDGKHEKDVIVVVNPKMKQQAKRWIIDEYMNTKFVIERQRATSVDPNQFSIDSTYSESLREFLTPKINENEIEKSKYGKKLRTYAEVTRKGEKAQPSKKNEKSKDLESKMKENKNQKKGQNQEIADAMIVVKSQIESLKELIVFMLKTIVADETMKKVIEDKLQSINMQSNENEIEEEENEEEHEKTKHQKQRKYREREENNNETAENDKKKAKRVGHPTLGAEVPGNVKTKVQWYENYKKWQENVEQENYDE